MTVQEILGILQEKAPFELAENWDNSGLLVGNRFAEVQTAVVALDVTNSVIEYAVQSQAQLIVTHHPVIFEAQKSVLSDGLVYRLAREGLTAIAVHTNADKTVGGVNDCLCDKLGMTDVVVGPDGMSRIGRLPADMSADFFAAYVAHCLATAVRVKCGTDTIRAVALCGGSAAEMVLPLLDQADAALTGEVKHHEWLAVPETKTLVDGGHYATEIAIVDRIGEWLTKAFPTLNVLIYRGEAPYETVKE